MSEMRSIAHDERIEAITNASMRRPYLVLVLGVLIIVFCRGVFIAPTAGDHTSRGLLALVLLSGGMAIGHQIRRRTFPSARIRHVVFIFAIAVAAVAMLAVIIQAIVAMNR